MEEMKKLILTMSFSERSKLGMEMLSKQPPVTLEQAKAQVAWLKSSSTAKIKKERLMQ